MIEKCSGKGRIRAKLRRMEMKRLRQLDGLRFIMFCVILLSHFEFLWNYPYGAFYRRFLYNSTMGVDYFFLLSGFGIYYSSRDQVKMRTGGISFAIRKIRKVYPLYVVSLLLSYPYAVMLMRTYRTDWLYPIVTNLILLLLALTLLQELSGMMVLSHAINGVGWFLSTLFLSYMLCPWFRRITERHSGSRRKTVGLWGGVILLILLITVITERLDGTVVMPGLVLDDLSYGSPYVRCWYLLLGMTVAELYFELTADEKVWYRHMAAAAVLIAVLWFFIRGSLSMLPFVLRRAVDLILVSFLLLSVSLDQGRISSVLSGNRLQRLGKDSMYFYLLHFPVRNYVDFLFTEKGIYFGGITGIIEAAVITAASLLVSLLVKKCFDQRNIYKRGF